MLRIARYRSERDNAPEVQAVEWDALVSLLASHRRTACDPCTGRDCRAKFGEAWSPVEIDGRRANANVRAIHVAVFDIDHVQLAELFAIAGRIDAAGLAAVLHSSHSHNPPGDCAARLVLRLSRPALASEWPTLRAALERKFQIPADKKTKDLARLYFLPSAPERGAKPIAVSQEGIAVDVDAVLAEAPALHQSATPASPGILAPLPGVEASPVESGPVDLGELRKTLQGLARRYKGSSRDGDTERGAIVSRILNAEPLANDGERDDTLNVAVSILATALPPSTPPEALLELLRVSVRTMPGAPPNSGDWLKEAAYKLERARERRAESDRVRKELDAQIRARLQAESSLADDDAPAPTPREPESEEHTNAPAEFDSETPDAPAFQLPAGSYTLEQLEQWARDHGTTIEGFQKRWIIGKNGAYYVFVGGKYRAPISEKDLRISLPRDLARAPLQLTVADKAGNEQPLPPGAILDRYATIARHIEASLALQKSYYDPASETFYEAARPLRKITPRQHPEIQAWIMLLGSKYADKLADWIATVTLLRRQNPAIYLDGPPGIGKTLLANGLARLWTTGGPSELHRVLDGFNDALVNCPLLFADEALPAKRGITAELRRLIGSTARSLRRLYMPTCNLDGAVRVIIAGNNDRLLDTGEDLSTNDLDAVAGRFLYIKAPPEAAEYLKAIGGPTVIASWIAEDKIAEHALWLRDSRKIDEGGRFLVEGEAQEFHEHLATGSGMAGLVCEWLARWLADPSTATQAPPPGKPPLILTGEGEVWVNTEAMVGAEAWEKRVPSAKVPSTTKIGRALRNMSASSIRVKIGDRQLTYHRVKPALLLSWVQRSQIGDLDGIRERIAKANETISRALAYRGEASAA